MSDALLRIEALQAGYGLLKAVRSVSFDCNQGQVLALIGANGAGKTTLMRTIAGAHPASAGRIVFDGHDITALRAPRRVGLGIAMVPEGRRLFGGMSVEDNLRVAGMRARKGPWNLESVLEAFPQLKPKLKAAAGTLSGGQQQATSIARALMTNPRVLLQVVQRLVCMESGRIIADGDPHAVMKDPAVIEAYLGSVSI